MKKEPKKTVFDVLKWYEYLIIIVPHLAAGTILYLAEKRLQKELEK